VRSLLHKLGFRFHLYVNDLPDKLDIMLQKYKTVIEVRGCYWHRHQGCKDATLPKINTDFWKKKFAETVNKDIKNIDLYSLCVGLFHAILEWSRNL
jgi:DNA mismatch endonuclease (patch repair protein)